MERIYVISKNKTRSWLWLSYELLISKFRLKLKKVGETYRPFRYDLNQILYDYIVEVTNRIKGLDLADRVPEELWMEVCNIAQEIQGLCTGCSLPFGTLFHLISTWLPHLDIFSWTWSSQGDCPMFFSKFGKALDIISSTNFSAPFSRLSFGDSHYIYVGVYLVTIHLIVSHRSLQLYISFLFFLLFRLGNFYWPILRLTECS